MTGRILVGGLAGGVVLFVVGAVLHLATTLGPAGLSTFPAEKEAALLAAVKEAVPAEGLSFFPGVN